MEKYKKDHFQPGNEIEQLKWQKSTTGSPGVWTKNIINFQDNTKIIVKLVKIDPGGEIIPHIHDSIEIMYILKGEGKMFMDKQKKVIFSKGSCVVAPAGLKHGLKNTLDNPVILLCIFTPNNRK
ncbi:MAG: cupin domain-containing protein [Eubacteriales bacterium]